MVLPVLAWGAVALAGAVSGYLAYDKWWDRKTIAVLGGRGVGKTTLIHYFATKQITTHEQTDKKHYGDMTVKIDDLTLKIKGGYDVGGSSFQRPEWRKQIDESDIIFYIMDISRVLGQGKDPNYIHNTLQDINDIKKHINDRRTAQKGNIKVMILATHADKCPEFYSDRANFEKKVARSQVIETAEIAFGGSKDCKVLLGSLKDTKEAEKLVKHILSTTNK